MSTPRQLTVIYTDEINGELMGIFVNNFGQFQYLDGTVTEITDTRAWWKVPRVTQSRGVNEPKYFYVYREDGYHRCSHMIRKKDGTVCYQPIEQCPEP
ncbi:hypothetical protein SAMD00023353_5500160 [Rosellinia necatrix]|uniref:Uncharacterized protein n=1 Tax=Rosellinia necatrix TaxID=77044 RepID=A0A1S8AB19_ROSNE|nr:hypothetical protein SAMD00023353_5500160 [Rosellinia necatrix]